MLVVAALILLSRATDALMDFRERYSQTFRYEVGLWLSWLVPAALSGAAFALAAAPSWTFRFRWAVSLSVGLIPVLLLAQTLYVFGVAAPNRISSPSWLARFYWYFDSGPQFVLAGMVGVALGLGFAGPRSSSKNNGPTDG